LYTYSSSVRRALLLCIVDENFGVLEAEQNGIYPAHSADPTTCGSLHVRNSDPGLHKVRHNLLRRAGAAICPAVQPDSLVAPPIEAAFLLSGVDKRE